MHNHSAFMSLLTVSLIIYCSLSKSASLTRKSDANANVFKLLLGLYKLNPLKGSPVFQQFSDNLLMGMGRSSKNKPDLNFESGESVKINEQVKMNLNEIENMIHTKNKKPIHFEEPAYDLKINEQVKMSLNEIENMIHTKNKKPIHFEKPAYDLDGVRTENFKAELVLDDVVLSKEAFQEAFLENHNTKEDFGTLFEHIGSNEIETDVPVTKLIPINDTITRYSQVSNQNEAVFSQLTDSKGRSFNHIATQSEFYGRNPKEVPMNILVGDTGDVIAF